MSSEHDDTVRDAVKDYYGKRLKTAEDLETKACVNVGKGVNKLTREAITLVHDEVAARYYGCGLVIPEKLEGMKVLDLGSGSGRDCFALSKLVGPKGHVTGIDMTDEQLAIARKYIPYHKEKFGYSESNVDYVKGYIEKLREAGLKDNTYDIIISNCVVNLSPDKKAVLTEAYNVLKTGGELYFSDVYSDRDLPDDIRKHEVLWGECIAGALWWKDLFRLGEEIGFSKPRLVGAAPIEIEKEEFIKVLGDAKFISVTYRLFKLPKERQDATQVIYNGTVTGFEDKLEFDKQHTFKEGDILSVDSELATILNCSRFKDEFEFQPSNKKSKGDSNSCCAPKKEVSDDPFEYLAEKEKKGEKVEASCCASTGTKCC